MRELTNIDIPQLSSSGIQSLDEGCFYYTYSLQSSSIYSLSSSLLDAPVLESVIRNKEFLSHQSPVSFNKHTNSDETNSQSLESMC